MSENRNFSFYKTRRQKKQNQSKGTNDTIFFNISLLMVACSVLYLILPMINAIIIGILTATIFYGLNCKIMKLVKGRKMVGAVTSTTVIALLVFAPLITFLYSAVSQGIDLTNKASDYVQSEEFKAEIHEIIENEYVIMAKEKLGLDDNFLTLTEKEKEPTAKDAKPDENISEKPVKKVNPVKVSKELVDSFKGLLTNTSARVLNILSLAGEMIFSLLITLLVMFYVFFDGERIFRYIRHLSPLPDSQLDRITERISSVSRSSILGSFLTAACHGIVGIIGLFFAGVPALFLGTLIGFCSVVPVVGTAIVMAPLLGYLLIVGETGTALFVLIWWLITSNIVDYTVRPILMKGDGDMPTVLLLFAIIGGVGRFGLLGFVYGPVLFGLMAVMLWIYEERNSLFLNAQDTK